MGGVIFIFLLILFFAWALSSGQSTARSKRYEEPLTIEEIRMLSQQCWNKPVAERRRIFMNYKRK